MLLTEIVKGFLSIALAVEALFVQLGLCLFDLLKLPDVAALRQPPKAARDEAQALLEVEFAAVFA